MCFFVCVNNYYTLSEFSSEIIMQIKQANYIEIYSFVSSFVFKNKLN